MRQFVSGFESANVIGLQEIHYALLALVVRFIHYIN
jgi:hypothetical protein